MNPIDFPSLLQASFINTVSGLAANAFLIILVIVIYRGLKKRIKKTGDDLRKQIKETGNNIIKNIPKWIQDYNKMMYNERRIEHARIGMDRSKE